VFHVGGGTLPNNNPRKLFLNYRNNLILLVKNLPSGLLVTTLLFRIFMDLAAAIVFLLTGKTSFFAAIIKAYWEFYKHSIYYKNLRKNYPIHGATRYTKKYSKAASYLNSS